MIFLILISPLQKPLFLSLKNQDSHGLGHLDKYENTDFNSSRPGKIIQNKLNRHFYNKYKFDQLYKALKYLIFNILNILYKLI